MTNGGPASLAPYQMAQVPRRNLLSKRILRQKRSSRRSPIKSCRHKSELEPMKVTIIGGGGRVGSCAAFALQCAGLVSEIQILDANKDMADGEALDLLHEIGRAA